jgi:hypothetical protein
MLVSEGVQPVEDQTATSTVPPLSPKPEAGDALKEGVDPSPDDGKTPAVLKDGDLSYSEAVKKQEAARRYDQSTKDVYFVRAGNYGGMSSITSNLTKKAPEIKMKLGGTAKK